ncbi:uncharacterized [Tachysurus ichikawai]
MGMLGRAPKHQRITIRLIGARASPVYAAFCLSEVERPSLSLLLINEKASSILVLSGSQNFKQTRGSDRSSLQMSQQEEKVCFDNDYLKGFYS